MLKFIGEKDVSKVMKKIGVCTAGINMMVPKAIFKRILLKDVRNSIANIIKQEMLAVGGDAAVNKGCVNCTIKQSDVLLLGTVKQLLTFAEKMKQQPKESKKISKQVIKLIMT